jgi:hypothetical protein
LTFRFYSRVKKAFFQRWIHAQSNQRWKRLTVEINRLAAGKAESSAPVIFVKMLPIH